MEKNPVVTITMENGDAVYDIHTFYYLSKRRIAAVQMGGVLVHNEELGTCGVGMSGSGHG